MELFVFDLLDIALVHGWLVSEEDAAAFAAVAPHSAQALRAGAGGAAAQEFLERSEDQLTLEDSDILWHRLVDGDAFNDHFRARQAVENTGRPRTPQAAFGAS
mmetsp:Transcript_109704/g.349823  ORF Transcript_109704/g.349823 Transcript_109704/m.349823 type:complete len:103 (+) Transcript_109704:187-495(+)